MNIVTEERNTDLLEQIDAFRQQAQILESRLRAREARVAELEDMLYDRQEQMDEMNRMLQGRSRGYYREDYPNREEYSGRGDYPSREEYTGRGGYPSREEYSGRGGYPSREEYSGRGAYPDYEEDRAYEDYQDYDDYDDYEEDTEGEMADVAGQFTVEITELKEALDAALEENRKEQEASFAKLTEELNARLDQLEAKTDVIPEKIHSESVQTYRNTQDLLEDLDTRICDVEDEVYETKKKAAVSIPVLIFVILNLFVVLLAFLVLNGVVSLPFLTSLQMALSGI